MNNGSINDQAPTPSVVAATIEDAGDIADIYNHYVRVGGATFDAIEWTRQQVVELLQIEPPEIWFVSVAAGKTVGWASARRFSIRFGYRLSLESAIYLSPQALGRGVADALQRAVEDRCRAGNIHHLTARIIADNQRSMAFHYRHGYELVGIQKEIGWIGDAWIDVAILQKIL